MASDHKLLMQAARLFADYSDCLNDWERGFIEDLTTDVNQPLTSRQKDKLEQIIEKMEDEE